MLLRLRPTLYFAALPLSLLCTIAHADFLKELHFETDGVLPSSDASITFFTNIDALESDMYTVGNGMLMQRTFNVDGNASYLFPNVPTTGVELDSALPTEIEGRLRALALNGLGGAYFQAFDGINRYSVFFEPTGVALLTPTMKHHEAADLSAFHSFRLVSPGDCNAVSLFIDDAYVTTVTAQTTVSNGFGFGDGITESGNGADVDWEALAVIQTSQPMASDIDQDGVDDAQDNCVGVPNSDQRDTDTDGLGNACDADLNNDCEVNFGDLAVFKSVFLSSSPDADFDASGTVGFGDLATFKSLFNKAPGPSCAVNICYDY